MKSTILLATILVGFAVGCQKDEHGGSTQFAMTPNMQCMDNGGYGCQYQYYNQYSNYGFQPYPMNGGYYQGWNNGYYTGGGCPSSYMPVYGYPQGLGCWNSQAAVGYPSYGIYSGYGAYAGYGYGYGGGGYANYGYANPGYYTFSYNGLPGVGLTCHSDAECPTKHCNPANYGSGLGVCAL